MTQDSVPVPPGTALAVIAPKPTVSAKEIAWAEAQKYGASGTLKDVGSLVGGGLAFVGGIIGIAATIASHGAAIPIMVALGGTGTAGGLGFLGVRRSEKSRAIIEKRNSEIDTLLRHFTACGRRALAEAIERGVVLDPGMTLPVAVDVAKEGTVWKFLRIEEISPYTRYNSAGRVFSSELVITAALYEDDPPRRRTQARYDALDRITHRIQLKAPVELAPMQLMPTGSALLPAPAPEAEVAPKDILAPPPREVAPAFAPARPAPRPSDDAGAAP